MSTLPPPATFHVARRCLRVMAIGAPCNQRDDGGFGSSHSHSHTLSGAASSGESDAPWFLEFVTCSMWCVLSMAAPERLSTDADEAQCGAICGGRAGRQGILVDAVWALSVQWGTRA